MFPSWNLNPFRSGHSKYAFTFAFGIFAEARFNIYPTKAIHSVKFSSKYFGNHGRITENEIRCTGWLIFGSGLTNFWVGFGRFLGLNGQKRPFLTTFRPLKSYIEFQWECDLPELIIEMNLVDTKSTLFCSGTHSVYLVSAESGQVVTQVQIEGNRMVKCTLLPIIEPWIMFFWWPTIFFIRRKIRKCLWYLVLGDLFPGERLKGVVGKCFQIRLKVFE